MMEVDTLTDCDDRKCKRPKGMVGGITNERRYRERWIKAFEDYLHLSKRDGWYLKKLQDLQKKYVDQQEQENYLFNTERVLAAHNNH